MNRLVLLFSIGISLFNLPTSIYAKASLQPIDQYHSQLIYKMGSFDEVEQTKVENLVANYGIRGVMLPQSTFNNIGRWIKQINKKTTDSVLWMIDITQIFELPFSSPKTFPIAKEVECFAQDSLFFVLGVAHANILLENGISVSHFNQLPLHYFLSEWRQVSIYFEGLRAGGQMIYLNKGLQAFVNHQQENSNWNKYDLMNIELLFASRTYTNKKLKKKIKQHLFEGMWVTDFNLSFTLPMRIIGKKQMMLFTKDTDIEQIVAHKFSALRKFQLRSIKTESKHFINSKRQVERVHTFAPTPLTFYEKTYCLIQDNQNEVPWIDIRDDIITFSDHHLAFQNRVNHYRIATHLSLSDLLLPIDSLNKRIPTDNKIIVDLSSIAKEEEFQQLITRCELLNQSHQMVVLCTGSPYLLKNRELQCPILWNPIHDSDRVDVMVQMVFGAKPILGKLPSYSSTHGIRQGEIRTSIHRMAYSLSGDARLSELTNQNLLMKIDTVVFQAITENTMPGCQIMAVKNNMIIWNKSYGSYTYANIAPINWQSIYDLASLTKVMATLPLLMWEVENKQMSLQDTVGQLIAEGLLTDKSHISMYDILIHQSGLRSYIPFWKRATQSSQGDILLYEKNKQSLSVEINWSDSISSWILQSPFNSLVNTDGTYRYLYSDLGFTLIRDVVEESCNCIIDQSLHDKLYTPMGMNFTGFNPLHRFPRSQLVPTTHDHLLRHRLLRGEVHDRNAALLDGVSGQAGLFSNANDLAKYMQMLLHKGVYGGKRYFQSATIEQFTKKSNHSKRRALGWDKPDHGVGNVSQYASDQAFGHSGFTGTLVWADPAYDLVYIFLSNRIYPNENNNKLLVSNLRTRIHDLLYESFLDLKSKLAE